MPLPTLIHSSTNPEIRASRTPFEPLRRDAAKVAFTCRRVPLGDMSTLVTGLPPRAGDLVLARVRRKRQHKRIELVNGRKSVLFVGDEIVVCYGNRYATDQFEAVVPENLGPCQLVASGGLAAEVLSRSRAVRPATDIEPIGLIGDRNGRPLNLREYAIEVPTGASSAPCIAVVGSSMNSGKTTSAARVIHGLKKAGFRVGAAKVTGTGSGGDYWKFCDAGATNVMDFTDAGHVSTFKVDIPELIRVSQHLTSALTQRGAEVIVLEIADGLLQQETAELVRHETFRDLVSGFIFAATDPMSAVAGADWLEKNQLPIIALCGTLTRSGLATREAADATGLPVLRLGELSSPQTADLLMSALSLSFEACAGNQGRS